MISSCRTASLVSKPCRNCNGRLLAPDNFCRWCGLQLSEGPGSKAELAAWHNQKTTVLRDDKQMSQSLSTVALSMLSEGAAGRSIETTVLRDDSARANSEEPLISHSLSRVVLDTLKQNVAMKTGSLRLNQFGVLAIAVLISIPMWLMIILLSPLHAFIAAKAASSQMSIQ